MMEIITKIYNKILAVLILLVILYLNIFVVSGIYDINENLDNYNYTNNKSLMILNDKEHCKIFNCIAIRKNNSINFYDKNHFMYKSKINTKNYKITDNYYIDINSLSLNININKDEYIYVKLFRNKDKMIAILLLSLPLLILIFGITISKTILEERSESIIKIAGNEALLTNKSMIMITENIHHEMNTPLEVIDNKIDKIKRKMQKLDPLKLVQIEEDFEFIDTSSAQIRNILNKMKTFKNLRYSPNKQSLYKIFSNVFKMISMSSSNYEYKISEEFKNIYISGDLTSSDLLNITLNHVKNSLEADASKVFIILEKLENDFVYVRIIDNGNGISNASKAKIFQPNFSTKNDFEGLRGNGMYLNKQIMINGNGNIKIISSSGKGTTIGLKFNAKIKSKKDKK